MTVHSKDLFVSIVGKENVKDTQAQLLAYSYDATANFQAKPDLVVSPRSTEEIAEIVKICAREQIPIVSRGSGTNLAAGTVPSKGGLIVLFNNMDKILEVDKENLTITVQPGVITQDICNFVESNGLFYPPDPSSMKISTIGGNVSENSGGLRGLKYGVTKDYVKAMTVVLPDGETLKLGGKLAKDVAGYDLMSLFVGAEGTLGIITEITLKLIPLPISKKTGIAYFNSLEAAAETVSAIIADKIIPVTLEFMDKGTIGAVEDFMKIGLPLDAEAMLLMEQDGNEEQVERDIQQMIRIAELNGATSTALASSNEEAEVLKTGRRAALSALARKRPTTILEDATVPRSEIANMVKAIQQISEKYDVQISTFGHAGDGNLHPTCLTDVRDEDEMLRVEQALAEIFHIAIELGGTITGEHGVGEMKAPYLEWKLGESGIRVMKAIKQSMDPQNIMNPGKMFAKETKMRLVINNGQ
ncbi:MULTISPECIES: FAD-linked oxidase C-terminal domain-containing protein [Planomicrobium]|uniref:FAD-linked oxidase C-terminal domain-containing protein n=1 Tax=Planomicrobium okeanokoites TaxID=244 RepID=A0ABV7KRA0_PLAOK|nr:MULTISPECIES: FAD-linked oxidase C-terminal domain-containing protein [Planomicrobium]PKH10930.1 glycolate oxidase subunit GlcD [Planomicrobium sp. MB-3u-38]TAA69842.1 FAD-binding protein [Planomicrobium okeanokoites]